MRHTKIPRLRSSRKARALINRIASQEVMISMQPIRYRFENFLGRFKQICRYSLVSKSSLNAFFSREKFIRNATERPNVRLSIMIALVVQHLWRIDMTQFPGRMPLLLKRLDIASATECKPIQEYVFSLLDDKYLLTDYINT